MEAARKENDEIMLLALDDELRRIAAIIYLFE
jgi:hypothetical protein